MKKVPTGERAVVHPKRRTREGTSVRVNETTQDMLDDMMTVNYQVQGTLYTFKISENCFTGTFLLSFIF